MKKIYLLKIIYSFYPHALTINIFYVVLLTSSLPAVHTQGLYKRGGPYAVFPELCV